MHNLRILLVEDELVHRRLFERNMQRYGGTMEFTTVEDGREALDYLMKYVQNPDYPLLVILDLKIPVMNGIQLLQKMQQDSSLLQVPVIVLTTSDDDAEREACESLGVKYYLNKPLEFRDLEKYIDNIEFIYAQ
jgi:CheY-like chemotaxis protein